MNSKATGRLPVVVKFTCGLEISALRGSRRSAIKLLVHLVLCFCAVLVQEHFWFANYSINHVVPPKEVLLVQNIINFSLNNSTIKKTQVHSCTLNSLETG